MITFNKVMVSVLVISSRGVPSAPLTTPIIELMPRPKQKTSQADDLAIFPCLNCTAYQSNQRSPIVSLWRYTLEPASNKSQCNKESCEQRKGNTDGKYAICC